MQENWVDFKAVKAAVSMEAVLSRCHTYFTIVRSVPWVSVAKICIIGGYDFILTPGF